MRLQRKFLFGFALLAGAVVVACWTTAAFAYCIIRDTGRVETPPGSGDYIQDCCDGNPRIWWDSDQPVPISILNTSPADTIQDVRDAHDEWTNMTASTFSFSNGGWTTIDTRTNDGTNVVGFDPNYCTARGNCGEGVLASSGCSTVDGGSSDYHAVDCDIFYNAEEYDWGQDTGERDPYPTCLHELGHNAGLTHPSDDPVRAPSCGCGPDANAATMWRTIHGGAGTLELDDWASIVSIYPEWRIRVRVKRLDSSPISGATVTLNNTCFPHDGTDYLEGGQIYGDINDCLIGDLAASNSYDPTSTYTTDGTGYTPYMRVLHNSFCFWAERAGYDTVYACVTLPSGGNWQTSVELSDTDKRDIRSADDLIVHDDIILGGDIRVKGTLYTAKGAGRITSGGEHGDRIVSASLSPRPFIVHRGTARLIRGTAAVGLPPSMLSRMDARETAGYRVKVTPTADCNGLFIDEKGPDHFVVREMDEGVSDASFNWEVILPRALPNNAVTVK